jgi:hypothetical protein
LDAWDPTGEKARAVKARYVGVCRGCGAYTQPRNGKGDAYSYCNDCHPGAIERRWTRERVIGAMLDWRRQYGRLPSSYDWSGNARAPSWGRGARTPAPRRLAGGERRHGRVRNMGCGAHGRGPIGARARRMVGAVFDGAGGSGRWIGASRDVMIEAMAGKRSYGTGELYGKHGSYYARWRTSDGPKLNRKVGPVRPPGTSDGLTRSQAERMFRKMQEVEEKRPSRRRGAQAITVNAAASSLRRAKALAGTRRSYLENLESMQRVHVDRSIGSMPLEKVSTERIETLASGLLGSGRSPKTVRNLLTFLYPVFEHAIANGWCQENPVRRAARPKRRRAGDASPDLQFLTVPEFEAVLRAIPDEVVYRTPAPTRQGRPGPAPPPPPDVLGPVLRVLILAAAFMAFVSLSFSACVGGTWTRWRSESG